MAKHEQTQSPRQRPPERDFDPFEWLDEELTAHGEVFAEFRKGKRKYGLIFVGCRLFPLRYHLFDQEGRLIGATRSRGTSVSAYCPFYGEDCVYRALLDSEKKSGAGTDHVSDYLGFKADEEPHYQRAARNCLAWRGRQIQAGRDLRLLADDCLHKEHYEYLEPISPDEFRRDEQRRGSSRARGKRQPERLAVDGVVLEQSPTAPFDAYVIRDGRERPIGYAQARLGVFRVVVPDKQGDNVYGCIGYGKFGSAPECPGRIVYRTVEGVSEGAFNCEADRDRLLSEAVRAVQEHTMSP